MENSKIKEEIANLKQALSTSKKENKKLFEKLEKSKSKIAELRSELKKNGDQKIGLTKEQEQLLLNLLKDMNIPNLLSD